MTVLSNFCSLIQHRAAAERVFGMQPPSLLRGGAGVPQGCSSCSSRRAPPGFAAALAGHTALNPSLPGWPLLQVFHRISVFWNNHIKKRNYNTLAFQDRFTIYINPVSPQAKNTHIERGKKINESLHCRHLRIQLKAQGKEGFLLQWNYDFQKEKKIALLGEREIFKIRLWLNLLK